MLGRCEKPHWATYSGHGGRGIKVCERWHDFELYYADILKLGPCLPGWSLDRIDNDGDYEPGNVRWATPRQQALNSRRQRDYQPPARTRGRGFTMTSRQANGVAIREIRKALGISQAGLAVAVGVNTSTMSRIEAGRQPRPELLRKIADYLGVPLAAISSPVYEPEPEDQVAS
jgi:DNA-binding XRE family transcriptional regulator